MPTLFISYKGKTDGVERLKHDLRAHKYALWFDRDDDWQGKLVDGLRGCAGMVLCLTLLACESKPIQFEVAKAREFDKPIFSVMLEPLPDIAAGLKQIGLPKRHHVEDFSHMDNWDEQFHKLLVALQKQHSVVTSHNLRGIREQTEYRLHKDYLNQSSARWEVCSSRLSTRSRLGRTGYN